jgi:hypothetical protein
MMAKRLPIIPLGYHLHFSPSSPLPLKLTLYPITLSVFSQLVSSHSALYRSYIDTIISRLRTLTCDPDDTVTTAATATSTLATNSSTGPSSIRTNNNVTMYYCWSHGLGKNRAHSTSKSCTRKGDGHQNTATADNLMGGSNRIMNRADSRPSRLAGTQAKPV